FPIVSIMLIILTIASGISGPAQPWRFPSIMEPPARPPSAAALQGLSRNVPETLRPVHVVDPGPDEFERLDDVPPQRPKRVSPTLVRHPVVLKQRTAQNGTDFLHQIRRHRPDRKPKLPMPRKIFIHRPEEPPSGQKPLRRIPID